MSDKWWRNAVIYQIYPLSFRDGNHDGRGDLPGIIEKLDYLNDGTERSLGVDAIWLSPIYRSPLDDFGYDVADHCEVDPVFGTLADFDRLVAEAGRRNIKIIMDFVPNHTSAQHPWFGESRSSRQNPKRDWYIWKNPKPDGSPPNNWLSVFGGPAWTLDEKTNQYYLHTFLTEQPDLNWRHPEVVTEMTKVLRFWLERGAAGFRTDALYHLFKHEQFPDEPPNPAYVPGQDNPYNALLHIYSQGQPELVPTIGRLCDVLEEKQGSFMVGEMWLELEELLKFHKACNEELHLPFNFNLITLPWNARAYRQFIDNYEKMLGPESWPNFVLGNHDQPRAASRLGKEAARTAAMLLLTLRGTPFIYYGEELGMESSPIPPAAVHDPWEKQVPGRGLGRDPERSPMQWDAGPNAGFGDGTPWLPVAPNFTSVNAAAEAADPSSMLNLYRRLIHFRRQSPALLAGDYQSLDVGQEDVFAFIRNPPTGGEGQKMLILLNFSGAEQKVSLDLPSGLPRGKAGRGVLTTYLDREPETPLDLKSLLLRPHEGWLCLLPS